MRKAMRDLDDVKAFIQSTLGDRVAGGFSSSCEEYFCLVRSTALSDLSTPSSDIREMLFGVAMGIVSDAIKTFLAQNYVGKDGRLEAYSTPGAPGVCDLGFRPIESINKVRSLQADLVDVLVGMAMQQFEDGRALAFEIVARMDKFEARVYGPGPGSPPSYHLARVEQARRDPPLELLEIELIRLERRLPRLTREEGARLSVLYSKTREPSRAS